MMVDPIGDPNRTTMRVAAGPVSSSRHTDRMPAARRLLSKVLPMVQRLRGFFRTTARLRSASVRMEVPATVDTKNKTTLTLYRVSE